MSYSFSLVRHHDLEIWLGELLLRKIIKRMSIIIDRAAIFAIWGLRPFDRESTTQIYNWTHLHCDLKNFNEIFSFKSKTYEKILV